MGWASHLVTVALAEKTDAPVTPASGCGGLPVTVVACVVGGILSAVFFTWMKMP